MKFLVDWHTRNFPHFEKILEPLKDRLSYFLEIGCLEGGTTCWLLQNFPMMRVSVIDTFTGCEQYPDNENIRQNFNRNMEEMSIENYMRVLVFEGLSAKMLRFQPTSQFDVLR